MAHVPSRILVTGATGNVGRPLVHELAARGLPVRAAVRRPEDADLPEGVETVAFDFTEPDTWADAFRGVRRLFLVRPPALSNVRRDLLPALDAAAEAGVDHVVFLSLLGAEKNPVVPHRAVERHLEGLGLDVTLLRPSFFMQNLSTTHRDEIRDRGIIFVPAGRGRTSFIDARDIADVAVEALTDHAHRGRAYTLTGREALTYHEAAAVLSDVLGRPVTYDEPGLFAFVYRRWRAGHPLAFVLVMAAIYTTCRLGLAARVTDDVERLLGRPPRTFRRFAEDHRDVWVP